MQQDGNFFSCLCTSYLDISGVDICCLKKVSSAITGLYKSLKISYYQSCNQGFCKEFIESPFVANAKNCLRVAHLRSSRSAQKALTEKLLHYDTSLLLSKYLNGQYQTNSSLPVQVHTMVILQYYFLNT